MKQPAPGSHWNLRGTIHVVTKVAKSRLAHPKRLVVFTVTEDGNERSLDLEWFNKTANPATAEEIGLTQQRVSWSSTGSPRPTSQPSPSRSA